MWLSSVILNQKWCNRFYRIQKFVANNPHRSSHKTNYDLMLHTFLRGTAFLPPWEKCHCSIFMLLNLKQFAEIENVASLIVDSVYLTYNTSFLYVSVSHSLSLPRTPGLWVITVWVIKYTRLVTFLALLQDCGFCFGQDASSDHEIEDSKLKSSLIYS